LRSNGEDEKTNKAKEILERIQKRNLYKLCGQFQPTQKLEINVSKAAEEIASLSEDRVKPNEIFVSVVNIHFGKKEQDPVKSVLFDKKIAEITSSIGRDAVSRMLPQTFSEQYVRVYIIYKHYYLLS
jgi:hypothetical protein